MGESFYHRDTEEEEEEGKKNGTRILGLRGILTDLFFLFKI
jgi:hypothetical protein